MQASQHGNTDAAERLRALSQPTPQALSREEHDNITDAKLVRRRTQAKQRSDIAAPAPGMPPSPTVSQEQGTQIIAIVRKNSVLTPAAAAAPPVSGRPIVPAGVSGAGMAGVGTATPRPSGVSVTGSPPGMGLPSRLPPQEHRRGPSSTLPPAGPAPPRY